MKVLTVSEITAADIAEYLRLSEVTTEEKNTLENLINIAIAYISHYTGLEENDLDNYSDFVIVVFILCQDMWDNRTLYVDGNNLNRVVETILGMHSVNLL